MTRSRSIVCGGIEKDGLSLPKVSHRTFHAADPLVESFGAFNEPFLRFPLTASRSYRKRSLALIARYGTDSAPHNWCWKIKSKNRRYTSKFANLALTTRATQGVLGERAAYCRGLEAGRV